MRRRIIEYLVSRHNRKGKDLIKIARVKPFLWSLQEDLGVYNAMSKSYYKIQSMDYGSLVKTVSEFNALGERQMEVVEPTTYRTVKTSDMDIKAFSDKDPKFLEAMVAEKLYDMRHAMVDRLWSDEGAFKAKTEYTDTSVKLEITLNIYNDGKKSDDE